MKQIYKKKQFKVDNSKQNVNSKVVHETNDDSVVFNNEIITTHNMMVTVNNKNYFIPVVPLNPVGQLTYYPQHNYDNNVNVDSSTRGSTNSANVLQHDDNLSLKDKLNKNDIVIKNLSDFSEVLRTKKEPVFEESTVVPVDSTRILQYKDKQPKLSLKDKLKNNGIVIKQEPVYEESSVIPVVPEESVVPVVPEEPVSEINRDKKSRENVKPTLEELQKLYESFITNNPVIEPIEQVEPVIEPIEPVTNSTKSNKLIESIRPVKPVNKIPEQLLK